MTQSHKFEQSELRPYPSLYKAGFVTSADHICELIFKNRETIFKQKFPESFWNGKYQKQYIGQKIHASRLLKKYSVEAIIFGVKKIRAVSLTDKKLTAAIKLHKPKEVVLEQFVPLPPPKQIRSKNLLEEL